MGKNKEVFDAELFAIGQALDELNARGERDRDYTVFSDSQAAISRVQYDRTGPGQTAAIRAINTTRAIAERDNHNPTVDPFPCRRRRQ